MNTTLTPSVVCVHKSVNNYKTDAKGTHEYLLRVSLWLSDTRRQDYELRNPRNIQISEPETSFACKLLNEQSGRCIQAPRITEPDVCPLGLYVHNDKFITQVVQ